VLTDADRHEPTHGMPSGRRCDTLGDFGKNAIANRLAVH
jgi:hypothetical protein